jgi:ubiquinone/menaquinone biosynthesis C-methylase UbiE
VKGRTTMSEVISLADLRTRVKNTWVAGDFGKIAEYLQPHGEEFIARLNIQQGTRVLDVACGSGNLSIPAATRGAVVTGVDIAPNLVAEARQRAAHEKLNIQFDEGDAVELPYRDAIFDLVVSMYGVMFAPAPEMAAKELLRVCRPGGTIALANWTPAGFIGQMLKTVSGQVPPPPGMVSPLLWGMEDTIKSRFTEGVQSIKCTPRKVYFDFPFSPADTVDFFITYYGPTNRALASLPDDKKNGLRQALVDLWTTNNQATPDKTLVESEYLEVLITRSR